MLPNKSPSVTLSLYLHLSCCLESFFPLFHHRLCSICRYAISIWSSQTWINLIITISIRLSTLISIGLPLSHWDKSYPYPSLLLNLYWTRGQVYRSHLLLLTAQLGHPPIGWHHPHLIIYNWSPPWGFNIQVAAKKVVKTQSSAWRARGPPYWLSPT